MAERDSGCKSRKIEMTASALLSGEANASAQDGSVGRTCMREVKLTAGAPMDIAVEWTGAVREIASVPFTGGRSPDGHFLATGTNNGYLLMLP